MTLIGGICRRELSLARDGHLEDRVRILEPLCRGGVGARSVSLDRVDLEVSGVTVVSVRRRRGAVNGRTVVTSGGKALNPENAPPAHVWPGLPAPGRKSQWWDKPPQQTLGRRLRGYQAGGEVIDDPMAMLQMLQAAGIDPSKIMPGVDPATLIHGAGKGAAPGAGAASAAQL